MILKKEKRKKVFLPMGYREQRLWFLEQCQV